MLSYRTLRNSYFLNLKFSCQLKAKRMSSNISPVSMAYNEYASTDIDSGVPPLVIMHGLFGSKTNWRGMSKALQTKFKPNRKIFAVDARNHGESPHSLQHSYEILAEDIAQFFDEQHIEKAAIMGHSMGGRAMMYFALKYPSLVDRAIILDISPVNIPRDFMQMENIFQAMKTINVSPDTPMAKGRKVVETHLKKAVNEQGTVDFIMQNLKKQEDGSFTWAANVSSLHKNFGIIANFPEDIIKTKQYRGPTLFIGGSQSNFINSDDWPAIQNIFPNSELVWLDCGHLVHFEQPAKFIENVTKFINKV